ncbi:MAG: hypothetical protein AB1394_14530 [Bacteroidota bacterium]
MLDTGCWILDTGCWMLDAGCWMLDLMKNFLGLINIYSLNSLTLLQNFVQ